MIVNNNEHPEASPSYLQELEEFPKYEQDVTDEEGNESRPSYFDQLDTFEDRPSEETEDVITQSLGVDPEEEAKVRNLSKKYAVPKPYVKDNLREVENLDKIPESSFFRQLEDRYPKTTQYLIKEKNYDIAKDDINTLSYFEDIIDKVPKAYKAGDLQVEMSSYRWDQMKETLVTGKHPTIHADKVTELERRISGLPENPDRWYYNVAEQVPNLIEIAKTSGGYGAIGALAGAGIGAALTTPFGGIGALPAAKTGFRLASTAGAFRATAMLEGGSAFEEYLNKKNPDGTPLDPEIAATAALIVGGLNGFVELVPLKLFLKTIPKSSLALKILEENSEALVSLTGKRAIREAVLDLVKYTVANTVTEGIQEATTGTVSQLLDKDKEFDYGLLGDRVSSVLKPAFQTSLFFGGIGTSIKLTSEAVKIRKAQQNKAVFLDIVDTVKESKVRKRDSESLTNFVNNTAKGSEVESVYIPKESFDRYFQSKDIDPLRVAQELDIEEQYNQSENSNHDLKIDLGTFTNKIADTEHVKPLSDVIKFNPDGITFSEIAEQAKLIEDIVKEEQAKHDQVMKQEMENVDGYQMVYDFAIEAQKKGGYKDQTLLDSNARLWAAHAVAESAKQGKTVQEWFVDINRPEVNQEMLIFGDESYTQQSDNRQTSNINYERISELGTTDSFDEAGFITPQGEMIDLSGKNEGKIPNARAYDHIEVGGYAGLDELMNQGVIRLIPEGAGIEIRKMPTLQQFEVISQYIDSLAGEKVNIDLYDGIGKWNEEQQLYDYPKRSKNLSYAEGVKKQKMMNDIKKFFSKSISERLFQGNKKLEIDKVRGQVQFDGNKSLITLFRYKDQSTFIHESAHIWLKDILNFVKNNENISEKYLQDWNTIKEYLKFDDSQENFTVDQQELFAKSFEKYLQTANAPSTKLERIFSNFKRWLNRIYRKVRTLEDIELSPEIIEVMDRMLATQDEIAEAISKRDFKTQLELEGVSSEIIERLDQLKQRARDKAEAILLKEQMDEITKERKEFLEKERTEAEKRIRIAETNTLIEKAKIDIMESFPTEQVRTIVKKYVDGKLKAADKLEFDLIAELYEFTSGDHLAKTILEDQLLGDKIREKLDMHMSQFDALMNKEEIKQKAIEALNNSESLESILAEGEILNEMILQEQAKYPEKQINKGISRDKNRIRAKLLKEAAKNILEGKTVNELRNLNQYTTYERNAAVNAAKAYAKGDLETAQQWKTKQALNHVLGSEAKKLKTRNEKNIKYLKSQQKLPKKKFVNYEYFEQIAAILKRFGFDRRDFPEDTRLNDKNKALAVWYKNKLDSGIEMLEIPDFVLDERLAYQDTRELTSSELLDITNAIKNIKKVAKTENEALTLYKKQDLAIVANKLEESQKKSLFKGKTPDDSRVLSERQRLSKLKRRMALEAASVVTVLRGLDSFKTFGEFYNSIYLPFKHASDKKILMMSNAVKTLKSIMSVYSKEELFKYDTEKIYLEDIKKSYTKLEIMMMALNWGNETNKRRLYEGFGLQENQIQAVLDKHMTRRDWVAVQNIWDMIDSFWAPMSKLYEELTGFPPEKVEATIVRTPHGDFKGGYFPLVRDHRFGDVSKEAGLTDLDLSKGNQVWRNISKNNHTKARADKATYRVSLDFNIISRHVHDVIHDITHRKELIDVNRLLNQEKVHNAILDAYGEEGIAYFQNWIKEIAGNNVREQSSFGTSFMSKLRKNVVIANLAWRGTVVLNQFSSAPIAATFDKNFTGFHVLSAYKEFYKNMALRPIETMNELVDFVTSLSPYMLERGQFIDRDLNKTTLSLFPKETFITRNARKLTKDSKFLTDLINSLPEYQKIQDVFIYNVTWSDRMVTFPIWKSAFKVGMELYDGNQQKAVDYADQIIKSTQGTGQLYDLPPLLKGNEGIKLFTMFHSFMNSVLNRLAEFGLITAQEYQASQVDYVRVSGTLWNLVMLPTMIAVTGKLLINGIDDKEPKEIAKEYAAGLINYPFSTYYLTKDLVPFAVNRTFDLDSFGYQISPIQGVGESVENVINSIKSKRSSGEKIFESIARTASYTVPYPQILNNAVFNIYDAMMNGMDFGPRDLQRRRPIRKRTRR